MTQTLTGSDLLSVGIVAYLEYRDDKADGTRARDAYVLRMYAEHIGSDIQLKSLVRDDHVDSFKAARLKAKPQRSRDPGRKMSAQNLSMDGQTLRGFYNFLRRRHIWPASRVNPAEDYRVKKDPRHSFVFVPESRFPEFLDTAGLADASDPVGWRNRARAAMGLFSFGRDIEIRLACQSQLRRVNDGGLHVVLNRPKVNRIDTIRSFDLLTEELEQWNEFYRWDLERQDIPWSLGFPIIPKLNATYKHLRIDPRPLGRGAWKVSPILEAMGYPVYKEGTHTPRRSGANAYHAWLTALGEPEPTRTVMNMLGHSDMATTEKYLAFGDATRRAHETVARSSNFGRGLGPGVQPPEPTRHLSVVRDVG